MNFVNRSISAAFDIALAPLERMGDGASLVLVSGVFGVLALLVFKHISWQAGIKAAKDKIKGHMIAIRLYQDDLRIVFGAILRILLRNFQYLGLNFGPILPLFVPFVLVAAQLVVRYAFDPLPVMTEAELSAWLPGGGTELEVRMKKGRESEVADLTIQLPPHLRALSPLARSLRDGIAVLEFAAVAPGTGKIDLLVGGAPVGSKMVAAGSDRVRSMQPERVSGFLASWLWPAEPTLPPDSPIDTVAFNYPDRELGYLPGGPFGVLLTFFVASILFGAAILKPLNIQI
jgi:hypothetical protein